MELQLGLALPTHHPPKPLNLDSRSYNKRSYSQLYIDHADDTLNNNNTEHVTLSLLPLTPSHSSNNVHDRLTTKNDAEGVVGWPPMNSRRKKLRYYNYGDEVVAGNDQMLSMIHHQKRDNNGSVGMRGSNNTLYVKVKMESVGIARKINLKMHHSFQTLMETLMNMFGKCHQHSKYYELAYQDGEGDWLLADDVVPWRSFIECAQRLKLVKNRI